jgi:hypothetical protein
MECKVLHMLYELKHVASAIFGYQNAKATSSGVDRPGRTALKEVTVHFFTGNLRLSHITNSHP